MVDQAEIHKKTVSFEIGERLWAVKQLRSDFADLPDKEEAWKDLHRLTHDKDSDVWMGAAGALGSAFPHLPNKEQAWDDLIQLTQHKNKRLRRFALDSIAIVFHHTSDKIKAQNDLRRLIGDEDIDVRWGAAKSLSLVFSDIPDKGLAWKDLIRLAKDRYYVQDYEIQKNILRLLVAVFPQILDKKQAWDDLYSLTMDKNVRLQHEAFELLGSVFLYIPNKERAWDDLIKLTKHKDSNVWCNAIESIGFAYPHIQHKEEAWEYVHLLTQNYDYHSCKRIVKLLGDIFPYVPNKDQAWKDLHRFTQDRNNGVRLVSLQSLRAIVPYIPDKDHTWGDLIKMAHDENDVVQSVVLDILSMVFPYIQNKEQAWKDIIKLTDCSDKIDAIFKLFPYLPDKKNAWKDLHLLIQGKYDRETADGLGSAFPYIPDKEQAWCELHRLTNHDDEKVRSGAAESLCIAFNFIPDKEMAWSDLYRLIGDNSNKVRYWVTVSFDAAYPFVPNRKQAWFVLHRLADDWDGDIRANAALAIGSTFTYILNEEQALEDLIKLTQDDESNVRMNANHSLGKVSIFKATKARGDMEFREEMENAIGFFERSSNEAEYSNPSRFCLPFYRSFYTVTFKKEGAEDEIQRYLTDAKDAAEGSKNKETLIKAVENLANALTEAYKTQEANLDTRQRHLNTYRKYCDSATNLIVDASKETPGAARVLCRAFPIIDETIKERISEIQEKAEAVCRETQRTPLEELGRVTARSAKELPTNDILALTVALDDMASIASGWCEHLPTDKKVDACEQLKNLTDMEPIERVAAIARVLGYAQKNSRIPKIQAVKISETMQETVRIAVAQFCFELTESFPFIIKKKDEVKTKIFSALEIARNDCANIVCLPELCLCEEWISEIRDEYPDMIVIGGSFYKDNKNICPLIIKSAADIPYQPKNTPSTFEYGIMKQRMIPGDTIYRYETQFGKFIILICRDFDDLAHYFRGTDIDMIFCPAFNPANERFQNEAHSHVERTPSYILIANVGLHGGTSIFGQINKDHFKELVDEKCKSAEDSTYKLCEVKEKQEEVIIADFNLKHKNIQKPAPSNPDEEIRSVENIRKTPI